MEARVAAASISIARGAGAAVALLVLSVTTMAAAQNRTLCEAGTEQELGNALGTYGESVYRLDQKFKDVFYFQGPIPEGATLSIGIEQVRTFLAESQPRKLAALFHAAQADRLCTWLITADGRIAGHQRNLNYQDWRTLQEQAAWTDVGLREARSPRQATPVTEAGASPRESWPEILAGLSDVLLPEPIRDRLRSAGADTLLVMPATVSFVRPGEEMEAPDSAPPGVTAGTPLLPASTRAALSIGTVPFAALPLDGRPLVEWLSIIVLPDLAELARPPRASRTSWKASLVFGDPEVPSFAPLPGARREALAVAAVVEGTAKVGPEATHAALARELHARPDHYDLIHLATHGIASAANPVDGSYLAFSDGRLSAREISSLRVPVPGKKGARAKDRPLLGNRPLVVLSACQTALGKSFPAGTIGLARAWLWAGAGDVVMSLWSVDDDATRELMTGFVKELARGRPVDKALQASMRETRAKAGWSSPSYWAGFNVFGVPTKLPSP